MQWKAVRIPGCEECDRLWREYAEATMAHVKAGGHLKAAALLQDAISVERLAVSEEDALRERESARKAIREHEAVAHGHDPTEASVEA